MNFLREIADFFRFFCRTPKEEKRIVFYAEHEGYYVNFEGIVRELTDRNQQTICYVTSDPNDPILRTPEPRIRSFYLKRLLAFFMIFVRCRVFVMTLTDLHQFHLKRSIHPVHYVYVFHSMVSTHMMYRSGAFDHYDSILCAGPHHVREIRKYEELHDLPRKELVETGYYRLEKICAEYDAYVAHRPVAQERTTVLIAPSWGPGNVIESCGERLVQLLLDEEYEVIVRPHPETTRRSPGLIDGLMRRYGDSPAFNLERSVATNDSLLRSDILICDCSGVALEYAFGTERPVLFLDVPHKVRNEHFTELDIEPLELSVRPEIGVIVPPEELDTVPSVIAGLKADQAKYGQRIAELRENSIYAFGRSATISANHVIGLTRGEDCQPQEGRN